MKVGIDLGGSHIGIGLVDENGIIIKKDQKRITNAEKEDKNKSIHEYIEDYIVENIEKFSKEYEIELIGMSIPGTMNKTTIIKSVNLGIENYNIVDKLKEKLNKKGFSGIPIKIRNDAKCAAIAENTYGCLKKYKRSIFLTLGTGIGGAVIINNELLDTGNLPGCEFGHIVIEKDGLLCNCGKKGCWERYASMKNLKNNLRKALNFDESVHGEELLDIIRKNSPKNENYQKIENVVSEFIENLSIGITNLINIFEPEAIGIGGSFVFFEDVFLERLKNKLLEPGNLFNERENINIETAILGNDAGIIGAL